MTQTERIVAIDVLRGFALLGILVMNIRAFASVFGSYSNPTVYVDGTGIHRWVWLAGHLFADMKMMTIFSMLFGAGILLMTTRQREKGLPTAGVHYRRMGWLLLIGLLHAHLLWVGDILVAYAVMGMLVYLCRRFYVSAQVTMAVSIFSLGVLAMLWMGFNLHTFPPEATEGMQAFWNPPAEAIEEELAAYGGSWLDAAPLRSTTSLMMQSQGLLFMGLLRIGPLMLLGMALYRIGVFSAALTRGTYWSMLIGGMVIGLPMIAFGYTLNNQSDFAFETGMFLYGQFNYVGSMFVAMAWVGLVMLVVKAGALQWLANAFAAVGQMALTNYLMQTIICTTIFYGHGFGLFGRFSYLEQFYFVIGVWIVELLWSPWWLKRYRFGPFEWVWRSLTYWRPQPMRR